MYQILCFKSYSVNFLIIWDSDDHFTDKESEMKHKLKKYGQRQPPFHSSLIKCLQGELNTFFLVTSHMPSHACLSFLPHHSFSPRMRQKGIRENTRPANTPKCYYWVIRLWVTFFFSFFISYKLFMINAYCLIIRKSQLALFFLTRMTIKVWFLHLFKGKSGWEMEVDVPILGANQGSEKTSRCGRTYLGSFCNCWKHSLER